MAFEINDWIKDILNHLNDINNSELTKGTVAYALKAKGGVGEMVTDYKLYSIL